MMADEQEPIVVGLDIGSTKVCAVAGRLVRNKDMMTLDVLGVGRAISKGVTKGSVVNIKNTVEAINKAIDEVSNQANVNVGVVNVALGGQHIATRRQGGSITRSSPGDEVSQNDINHLLADMYRTVIPPGTEIVHVLPMDFTVDGEAGVEDPVGRTGVKLGAEFQIITAQTNSVLNTRKSIDASAGDLKRDHVVLASLASAMAVLTEEERDAGVVLVDIGGGTTDIAIYYRGVLRHVAVLPWAGNHLTKDIQEGCRVLPAQAELLKTKFGNADSEAYRLNEVVSVPGLSNQPPKDVLLKNVSVVIEERLKEIAALVYAEIARAGYENKLLGGVVLTGGTASLPNIEQVFQRVTGLYVRVGYPEQLEHNPRADLVADPAFATAVGLVWAGFRSLDERITFISDPYRSGSANTGPVPVAAPAQPVRQPVKPTFTAPPAPPKPPKEPKAPGKSIFSWIKEKIASPDLGRETDTY